MKKTTEQAKSGKLQTSTAKIEKSKMRIKRIKIPVYFGTLVLIETEDLNLVGKKYGITDDLRCFQAITFKNENSLLFECVMAYAKGSKGRDIAHECVHFISQFYISRGVRFDPFNDEPQAYLMGWVFEQNERFINNK